MSSSRGVIKKIESDGWYLIKTVGSHQHFKHPNKLGKVTVHHPKNIYQEVQKYRF